MRSTGPAIARTFGFIAALRAQRGLTQKALFVLSVVFIGAWFSPGLDVSSARAETDICFGCREDVNGAGEPIHDDIWTIVPSRQAPEAHEGWTLGPCTDHTPYLLS